LKAGKQLDGIGGYTCYGVIENCAASWRDEKVPICLSEGLCLTRDVSQYQPVFLQDVVFDPDERGFKLYAQARNYQLPLST